MAAAGALAPSGEDRRAIGCLIDLTNVSKEYDTGGTIVRAMHEVSLTIAPGEFVAIVGASGSGKSTMMNILGCLDRPTRGSYTLAGIDVGARAGDSRAIVRNRVIGFIFQGFNLLPRTTALENVELPLQYRGVGLRERRRKARAALAAVGLADRLDHTPNQLSGGQQQRVAIARALVADPPLLLADEPTGNLDTRTSLEVLSLLQTLNHNRGITIVLVTHEHDIAACASRVVTMRDGQIVSDVVQPSPLDAAAELTKMGAPDAFAASAGPDAGAGARHTRAMGRGASLPVSVFVMMAVGELFGAGAVSAYIAFALGLDARRYIGLAALLAQLGLAFAGARWARRRLGAPPTFDQRVRMAFGYTAGVTFGALAVLAVALIRFRIPHLDVRGVVMPLRLFADRGSVQSSVLLSLIVLAVFCAAVLLRYLLLTLFAPRR
jgi:putative ABC transport system ATP-binding protein